MKERKRILVTAGSTIIPIDKVRVISNIFKGRTGTDIARYFAGRGHKVTLLTSNTHLLSTSDYREIESIVSYKTYDELNDLMEKFICKDPPYDAIIHSSAVSDYGVDGVFVMNEGGKLEPIDQSGKISSKYPVIYLRMPVLDKIIDRIRMQWRFTGILVKFKLQVAMSDTQLVEIAKDSRDASDADIIVANCLEWSDQRAYIITESETIPVVRSELAEVLHKEVMRWKSFLE